MPLCRWGSEDVANRLLLSAGWLDAMAGRCAEGVFYAFANLEELRFPAGDADELQTKGHPDPAA
jgi:hypothetical protein